MSNAGAVLHSRAGRPLLHHQQRPRPITRRRGQPGARPQAPRCSFGGSPNFRPPGGDRFDGPGGRFNAPGMDNENFTRTSGGLILPSSLTGAKSADEAAAKPNEMASFRPPVESIGLEDDGAASDEDRMTILSRRQGAWYELAVTLQYVLARFPPTEIDERTGITQKEQNLMVGAYKVRKTLVDEGRVSEEVISYFNTLDAAELLYEFRAIPTELREDMAQTTMEERLDKGTIVEIVRSIKEYDAREGHRTEFQRTPRDCYAFNIFRMINVSVMREQEVRELVAKAQRIGVSSQGREALDSIIRVYEGGDSDGAASEAEVRGAAAQRAKLPIGRLSGEDIHSFIIPVVGTLATSTVADFEAVQVVAPGKGPFSVKSIPSGGKYATVPQLSVLRTALDAVVVMVDDRRVLPTQNKGLQEPAMLVIDRATRTQDEGKYFLARDGNGLQVVQGGTTPDADVLGKLLVVLLRPTESMNEERNEGQEIVERMLNPGAAGF